MLSARHERDAGHQRELADDDLATQQPYQDCTSLRLADFSIASMENLIQEEKPRLSGLPRLYVPLERETESVSSNAIT